MSTHAAVIAKIDGKWQGIYVGHDGYHEGVGQELLNSYTSAEKVASLIARGDLSSLAETPEASRAYADPPWAEELRIATGETWEKVAEQIDYTSRNYIYVWDNGWTVNGRSLDLLIRAAELDDKDEDELREMVVNL